MREERLSQKNNPLFIYHIRGDVSTVYLTRETSLIMVFKLIQAAEKSWRRLLDGKNQLKKVIKGVKFYDGCEVIVDNAIAA